MAETYIDVAVAAHREPLGLSPQRGGGAGPPVRPADVQQGEPRERRLEGRIDDRESDELVVVGERAEERRAAIDDRCTEIDDLRDRVILAVVRPRRDVRLEHRHLDELAVAHRVLHVDMLRPIDPSDQRNVGRAQVPCAHHRDATG